MSVSIGSGEHVALLGPSGSGKSTLLRALLAALPVAGRVRVGGVDPHRDRAAARAVRTATGFLRQGNDLVLGSSARLNAVLGTAPSWSARDWARVAAGRPPRRFAAPLAALAERHGITGCLDRPARTLSGGQRQRVALVRALLPAPRLLLADEPTSGLDPVTAAAAVDAIRALGGPAAPPAVADAVTVLVTTHDLAVARRFPRIVALRAGRLVYDGASLDEATAARIYGGASDPVRSGGPS